MDRVRELQLGLWREACRHIDLASSISDLVAVIRSFVPIESMWVFSVASDRTSLVATHPADAARPFSIVGEHGMSLVRFARKGGVCLFHPARPARSLLRPLAKVLGDKVVISGALSRDTEGTGIVVWRLTPGEEMDDRVTTLLAATLEPLSVALDTSRRFHELEELRRSAEADRNAALQRLGRETLDDATIIGAQPGGGLEPVLNRVDLVARSDMPVLILGDTGSGKEVVARAIHARSPRHDGPFHRVNCGAIAADLIDSELFGHEKGAFTGATATRQGWFERANGGTLFLDEVAELSPAAQVRLLRVLQDSVFERVGGQQPIHVNVRIVAATHRDLPTMIDESRFREDLWYRLAAFPIRVPPLRERLADVADLAAHFALRASRRFGLAYVHPSAEDVELLRSYDWPGNVREFAAVLDRAAILGQGRTLDIPSALGLSVRPRSAHPTSSTKTDASGRSKPHLTASDWSLDGAMARHITVALESTRGRIEGPHGAAKLLGINPHTLRSRMRKLGVEWQLFREP